MTYEEAIRKIKEFGLHHAIEDLPYSSNTVQAFEMAIEALKKQSELAKGIEDLRDTLNDAYDLNDFVLNKILIGKPLTEAEDIAEMFSIKAMQNLSWLLAVIDGSDNE